MRKSHTIFALIAILITQHSFANVSSTDVQLKQCKTIVDACLSAGFVREGAPGKSFWHDCMKPVLLGQAVAGINVDPKDVKACKEFKIQKMKNELKELQQSKLK